jgi:SAM-dependent methyltransferase
LHVTPPPERSNMPTETLQSLLACRNCGDQPFRFFSDRIACESCGTSVPIVDGIVDLIGDEVKPIQPFYRDPAYARFFDGLDRLHEAHYGGKTSGRIEQLIKADLIKLVNSLEPPVLDLGCGTGSGFAVFGAATSVIGVDSNLQLLRTARKLHPDAALVRSTIDGLPLRSGSVRSAFAIGVLEHVFHLERAIENVARFMHPEGRFYVAIPTEGGLAVDVARLVTSRRNAALLGLTPVESRRAQRKDHCNTLFAIENALRKHFSFEATTCWPFRVGGATINLTKSYRLSPLAAG